MKIVKLSCGNKEVSKIIMRQTPGGKGVWGEYKFIADDSLKECDCWIVCHVSGLMKKTTVRCDPKNIIYVSMEPDENIPNTNTNFLSQFSKIIICDDEIEHKNIEKFNVITWWVGIGVKHHNNIHQFKSNFQLDYDKLSAYNFKEKLDRVSIVISKKAITSGHIRRLEFLDKLKKTEAGKYIDIYGGGFNPVMDKWEVIEPYKYHLVLENSEKKYYWSEKLGDAFLGMCLPFYAGCLNIDEYFEGNAIISIDMNNVEKSAKSIIAAIENNEYQKRFESINKARKMVLNNYNIFNVISRSINNNKIGEKKKYKFISEFLLYRFNRKKNNKKIN